MTDKYILKGKKPVPCKDLLKWAKWFETGERIVQWTKKGKIRVSTVFLGLDHNFTGSGKPLLFETMIFGGKHDQFQDRCSTWVEAEQMHKRVCKMAFK